MDHRTSCLSRVYGEDSENVREPILKNRAIWGANATWVRQGERCSGHGDVRANVLVVHGNQSHYLGNNVLSLRLLHRAQNIMAETLLR